MLILAEPFLIREGFEGRGLEVWRDGKPHVVEWHAGHAVVVIALMRKIIQLEE